MPRTSYMVGHSVASGLGFGVSCSVQTPVSSEMSKPFRASFKFSCFPFGSACGTCATVHILAPTLTSWRNALAQWPGAMPWYGQILVYGPVIGLYEGRRPRILLYLGPAVYATGIQESLVPCNLEPPCNCICNNCICMYS